MTVEDDRGPHDWENCPGCFDHATGGHDLLNTIWRRTGAEREGLYAVTHVRTTDCPRNGTVHVWALLTAIGTEPHIFDWWTVDHLYTYYERMGEVTVGETGADPQLTASIETDTVDTAVSPSPGVGDSTANVETPKEGAPVASRTKTSSSSAAKTAATNGTEAEPKLGARAGRRFADIEKALGKTKAKAVLAKATATANKKGDKLIRLDYLFEAEGLKMPAHAKAHYGKKDVELGTFDPDKAPERKTRPSASTGSSSTSSPKKTTGSGQGNAQPATQATGKTQRAAGTKPQSRATTASGSRSSNRKPSSTGQKRSSPKTDEMRKRREKQAAEAEAAKAAPQAQEPVTPATEAEPSLDPASADGQQEPGTLL